MLTDVVTSTLSNLVILVAFPLGVYFAVHRIRHGRGFGEVARRAGLQVGEIRYLWYCAVAAALVVGLLVVFPPSLEPFMREGTASAKFVGLGLGLPAIAGALLYGVVQTGFSEELLFRGLIAGSLSRRLPPLWANVAQALVFLLPHILVVVIMPEMWAILIIIFGGALFAGWVRIESDSVLGPWLLHSSANVTMALSVAIRSAA